MGRIQRTRQDPPGGAQDLGIWGSGDLEIRGSASRVSRAETSCGNIGASLSRRVQQVAGEQTRPLCGNIPFYLVRSDLVDAACSALTRGVLSRDRQMIRIAAWFFHLVCARPQVWDPPCGIPLVGSPLWEWVQRPGGGWPCTKPKPKPTGASSTPGRPLRRAHYYIPHPTSA